MNNIFDRNYKIVTDKLLCPDCFGELGIATILENSTVSWPQKNWIYLQCPKCKSYSHIELLNNMIKTGQLDGAPGPVFVVCSMLQSNDLFVEINEKGIICEYDEEK